MNIHTITEFTVKPGEAARFEQAYREGQMLERAATNPGFLRGELLNCVDDAHVFLAVAEWRSLEDYRAWQNGYARLPEGPRRVVAATLAKPIESRVFSLRHSADQHTLIE